MFEKANDIQLDASDYLKSLAAAFGSSVFEEIESLAKCLLKAWTEGKHVYICGNGGSAANAIHLANDFHYGIGACGTGPKINGIKVEALSANAGIVTCLANDTGYEHIYSKQLEVKAGPGDVLIVLSGSGNSPNVVNAIKTGKDIQMVTCSITAYSGGKCLELSDIGIHFPVHDMQIAEDAQLISGHICMQWLSKNKPVCLANKQ